MSYDDIDFWLITAMSLTATVFLLWTFAAVIRTSRSTKLTLASRSRALPGLAGGERDA